MSGVPETMRALVVERYGDWRSVAPADFPVPRPGPGEVLIEVAAASLNFPDLLMIEGRYQTKPALPFVPGRDAAGTVVAVGPGVAGLSVGDRVAAQPPHGAFGAFAVAPEGFCTRLPDAVGFEEAAACGTVFATVVGALALKARLEPGEWVLVTGAAGGVGSAAVQYARCLGGRVAALVSSAEKEASARALGAEIVLRSDRIGDLKAGLRDALKAEGLDAVDAALDVVGGDAFDGALRCLRAEGRLVVVGFASGRIPQIAANYLLLKDIAVMGSSLDRLLRAGDARLLTRLEECFRFLAEGRMRAPIDGRYPLADFAKAAARVAERQVVGKIVLLPEESRLG